MYVRTYNFWPPLARWSSKVARGFDQGLTERERNRGYEKVQSEAPLSTLFRTLKAGGGPAFKSNEK
jgi:hypothetical protein